VTNGCNARHDAAACGAVDTDILLFSVEFSSAKLHRRAARKSSGLSGVNELPDDHPHDDFAAPTAALRPP